MVLTNLKLLHREIRVKHSPFSLHHICRLKRLTLVGLPNISVSTPSPNSSSLSTDSLKQKLRFKNVRATLIASDLMKQKNEKKWTSLAQIFLVFEEKS